MNTRTWEGFGIEDLRERLREIVGTTVTDITVAAGSIIISFGNGKELVLFHADYENMIASYDGMSTSALPADDATHPVSAPHEALRA